MNNPSNFIISEDMRSSKNTKKIGEEADNSKASAFGHDSTFTVFETNQQISYKRTILHPSRQVSFDGPPTLPNNLKVLKVNSENLGQDSPEKSARNVIEYTPRYTKINSIDESKLQ